MDYQKTASEILKHIGGEKNVVSLEHCSTRLRFILADRSKADADAVKKIPGVMGVADKVQFQIIIGNSVVEVYEAILKQASFSGDAKAEKKRCAAVLSAADGCGFRFQAFEGQFLRGPVCSGRSASSQYDDTPVSGGRYGIPRFYAAENCLRIPDLPGAAVHVSAGSR